MQFKSLMLAEDWDEGKQVFPVAVSPKLDGVRAANFDGTLRGRSLKTLANLFTTEKYSEDEYEGFDGELVAADLTHPDLCRLTTSATSTIHGQPNVGWCVFDFYTEATKHLGFTQRHAAMVERKVNLQAHRPDLAMWLYIVPYKIVNTMEELLWLETQYLEQGYEGVILRDPNGLYKEGRATVKQRQLLRIKRFIEEDALVTGIIEGNTNTNTALINERGLQYRQTLADGMVPNGMVGSLTCTLLKDIKDPITGTVILLKGAEVTVSPGKMTENECADYFNNPSKIVGHVIKFKFFPKGVKDKPRFPTYVAHRDPSDMVKK
jgi:DNA ligase-1